MTHRMITFAEPGRAQAITTSTTTAKTATGVGPYTELVYVFNDGSTVAYVNFGPTGGAATVADGFPIPAGTGMYLGITGNQFVHAILATGTGTVRVIEMNT